MKRSKVLAIVGFFVLVTSALAQVQIIKANVPFDFVVGNQKLPAGEYSLSLNGAAALRIAKTSSPEVAGIMAVPVAGNIDPTPRLLFHRYGNRHFLAEVWLGEMSTSHRLYTSAAELEYAKDTKQRTSTILAAKVTSK